ncbi:MAG: cytochrome c [Flavobacteriales bacterium]|nr:cytochrome c [Flavobacteriales bacterium]
MKKRYLNIVSIIAVVTSVISVTSCREKNGLAPEYMPDMYRSPAIEPYVDYADYGQPDEMSARKPVEGTIPRGFTPYTYENTPEGYELAGQNLKNPIAYSENIEKQGEELYGMFCVHCHGKDGQGMGSIVEREKFPPIPTKFSPSLDLAEGKMFHTITYGKGLMGSHASQLTQEERWKLVHYIRAKFMGVTIESNVVNNEEQPTDEIITEVSVEEHN